MRFAMLFTLVGLALLGNVVSGNAQTALTAARERALKPRDTFKECATCPQMIVVPAGSFVMGSPDNEEGHSEAEAPQHDVTFARAFAVGQFAVTFEEWDACVAAGGCKKYRPADEGWGRGRQPVINVSWDDAELYVTWLSSRTGKAYRLLSEAEFEYVTRAGTTTPFWWGASISTEQANYDGRETYGGGAQEDARERPVVVNMFAANPWGIYQVHGNVDEWTEDCWHENFSGAPANGSAWVGADCGFHVHRGGAWNSSPEDLRAAARQADSPDYRTSNLGFRVARTLAN
jgi:formylglycine-generating enzyme required for sulfatase activity